MKQFTSAKANSGLPTPSIRVAAFTGGETSPSPRFRVRQYLPYLGVYGVNITEFIARFGSWPPENKSSRPFWLAATLLNRVSHVVRSYEYDVTLLQREMVSTLTTLERFTRRPRVLDVDDAVWLNRGAQKNFAALAGMCDGVICGNNFIAENVAPWNREFMVLPTAVDTQRYQPADNSRSTAQRKIIGWSGLGSGLKYLMGIEPALYKVFQRHKDSVLRIVSDVKPRLRLLDSRNIEFIQWSPENEVQTIREMSVGLMPVDDSLWSRGKCSYKMLLYMACAVPVVVSAVGMNNEVLALGNVGFGSRSEQDWVDRIGWLLDYPEDAAQMGIEGRRIVNKHFSLTVLAPQLAAYLKKFAE
ncbi:MAG TPA: glycosyltransferase family 4 protein [Candidatus Angelobacter sp.]|jgi:glycosyltransferase involved in cell wall biosynthesis